MYLPQINNLTAAVKLFENFTVVGFFLWIFVLGADNTSQKNIAF
jgi:hypothetical protein